MKYIIIIILFIITFFNNVFSAGSPDSGKNVDNTSEFFRATKLINQSEFEKAHQILKSILNELPKGYSASDLYNYYGFTARKKKKPDFDLSEKYYLKALSIDPNHIGALEYLGELYVDLKQLDKAKDLLERLKNVAGENSDEYKELFALINN